MQLPLFLEKYKPFVSRWFQQYRWQVLGIVLVGALAGITWMTPPARQFVKSMFSTPQAEVIVESSPTPEENKLAMLEERALQLEMQINEFKVQRGNDLAEIKSLKDQYQAAISEVAKTHDELVKQGEQLKVALKNVKQGSSLPTLSFEEEEEPSPTKSSGKININTANVSQLDSLPGIGPAYAQRIVDYRTTNGPFKKVDDLDKVQGIGQSTIDKIRDLIEV